MQGHDGAGSVVLAGRRAEVGMLAHAIAAARQGRSSTLVISGEPGLGKTALLGVARDLATGFRVVQTRGIAEEAALPFAGLAAALRPLLGALDGLEPGHRTALEGALALGPPVGGGRFPVYAAALRLLVLAAEHDPLLCMVDDAHAMDAPSLEAMLFIARRLEHEGVVMLIATRDGHDEDAGLAGLPVLRLSSLGEEDSRGMLRRARGAGEMAPWVEEAVLRAAAGNPLALRELPRLLTPDQAGGRSPLADPLIPGRALLGAFRERLEALPPPVWRAVVLAACSMNGDVADVRAALSAGDAPGDLDAAMAAGVLTVDGDQVLLAHPVLRSVAIALAGGRGRREAHRALALAAHEAGAGDRHAWHLARAAIGPDARAADALAVSAARASSRGAVAAAAQAFDRSARLTPDPAVRAARLLGAAGCALDAGRAPWALAMAAEAGELTEDEALRERADLVRGMALLITGDVGIAHRVLAPPVLREPLAAQVHRLGLGAIAAILSGDPIAALGAARRALMAARQVDDATARMAAAAALAHALVVAGDRRAALRLLAGAGELADVLPRSVGTAQAMSAMALAAIYAEDTEGGVTRIAGVIASLRQAGNLAALPFPLMVQAVGYRRMGRWSEALAVAQESIDLGRESSQDIAIARSQVTLAGLHAAMGHEGECRRAAAGAQVLIERTGASALGVHCVASLGLLELGMGRPAVAVDHLRPLSRIVNGYGAGGPCVVPWRPDLVEALARMGRRDEALAQLRVLVEEAGRSGSVWAAACVARCRGLIDDDDPDRHFMAALADHERHPQPFEQARTQLVFGERLRRQRRRAEARSHLLSALEVFERLGATPWAHRATEELDATGVRAGRRDAATDLLTPRELQVATAVAAGATNREVAGRLFLSEKTIERHLASVYRKLGLRSRSQLARHLAASAPNGA